MNQRLKDIYIEQKIRIEERLRIFRNFTESATDRDFFDELAFCTLTPQAKPEEAQKVLTLLKDKELLYTADAETLSAYLGPVRFRFNKAKWLVFNRKQCLKDGVFTLKTRLFELKDPLEQRKWLVSEMKGIGWKEASHFLRNTGLGLNLAILDRHILRALSQHFDLEIPKTLTGKTYVYWEALLVEWAKTLEIPFAALDFVIFYDRTGVIFK